MNHKERHFPNCGLQRERAETTTADRRVSVLASKEANAVTRMHVEDEDGVL